MTKLLTTIRDLTRRKAREKRGLVLAEGIRLVEEAVSAGLTFEGAVVSPQLEGTERGRALKASLLGRGVAVEEVDEIELGKLADTEHPQGIIAVVAPREWTAADLASKDPRTATILVLDAVQDPGNVGTILRTALALGATCVLTLPGTVDLHNPKVLRASMGASFRLPNLPLSDAEFGDLVEGMAAELWVTAMDGDDVRTVTRPAKPLLLCLGNEGAGVRPDLAARATRRVAIPIAPGAESLNVAAAAAIFLWESVRGR